MRYHSTRSSSPDYSFFEAVELGLAPDGGLFVPATFPSISTEELLSWKGLSYRDVAFQVLRKFIPQEEMLDVQLK